MGLKCTNKKCHSIDMVVPLDKKWNIKEYVNINKYKETENYKKHEYDKKTPQKTVKAKNILINYLAGRWEYSLKIAPCGSTYLFRGVLSI